MYQVKLYGKCGVYNLYTSTCFKFKCKNLTYILIIFTLIKM